MRKLFSLFAALTLSVGLWAETVSYLYPVYNDPTDVTKGIASWQTSSKDATPISSSSRSWGADGEETWLVVNENVTISKGVTCKGDVHLILADGVTLTTKGIIVSGEDNSLTIYAQTEDPDHMGQLIATSVDYVAGIGGGDEGNGSNITINGGKITANGGSYAAGIGGGQSGNGSNITINGGEVTATGEDDAAGIGGGKSGNGSNITINGGEVTATGEDEAAGIGGGGGGSGSNITINGGEVTATGGDGGAGIGGGRLGHGSYITINGGKITANSEFYGAGIGGGDGGAGSYITILAGKVTANGGNLGAGIGGGWNGSAFDIFVATSLIVKADGNNPPTTVITNTGADLASSLAGKQYATIEIDIPSIKAAAIAAVNAEISETDNDNVKAIATSAATAINAATTVAEINALKNLAIANIASAKAAYGEAYGEGYDEGEAAVRATLPTEGYDGPAVIITKGEKVLTLFNPEKVEYKILEAD